MVVFDTSILAIAFDRNAAVPIDPDTGIAVTHCKERIDHLLLTLSAAKTRVLIPTPVLSEYLVRGGADKDKRLQEFTTSKVFNVGSFDMRAAVECSMLGDPALNGSKKLSDNETWAKVKFDRQIIAIAKTLGATTIYTGDKTLAHRAKECSLTAVMTWEIPLPPVKPQGNLFDEIETATEPEADATK